MKLRAHKVLTDPLSAENSAKSLIPQDQGPGGVLYLDTGKWVSGRSAKPDFHAAFTFRLYAECSRFQ